MLTRRTLTIGLGASLTLAACAGPEGPGTLTLRAQAAPGANPGPDGTDRPLALTLLQLDGPAAVPGGGLLRPAGSFYGARRLAPAGGPDRPAARGARRPAPSRSCPARR